jgi:cyclic pyranopterin phosphate synthase
LSVTTRCQFRCRYCRPEREVADSASRASPAELLDLVELIHGQREIAKVRLTGGEPLLVADPPELVRELRRRLPHARIGLTTNGVLLSRYAEALCRAGLNLLNISLDTLDPPRCRLLTRGGRLDDILDGIRAARRVGFQRTKLNSVLLRSVNGDHLDRLVRFAAEQGCEIRFIELMPYGEGRRLSAADWLPAEEALEQLGRAFSYLGEVNGTATARRHRFLVDGREQVVGFITGVSHPFCDRCDRLRLDSRGRLFSCLRQAAGEDLLTPWREGRIEAVREQICRAVEGKAGPPAAWPERPMVTIGG